MSLFGAALVAVSASLVTSRGRTAGAVGLVLAAPLVAAVLGLGAGLVFMQRRLRSRREERTALSADVGLLTELVGLGISAGLSLSQSLAAAHPHVHPGLAAEVRRILRTSARGGLAAALFEGDGDGRPLYQVCARAVVTGAPLGPALDALAREQLAEERTARLEAARRLPVRLMVPLALLILPGFVLLTVGPAVLAALNRFALPR